MYKLTNTSNVVRLSDGLSIPPGESLEWGLYQEFLAQGGVPDPVDRPSLEARKTAALGQVDAEHQAVLLGLTGNPTDAERNTWGGKVDLARSILAGAALHPDQAAFLSLRGLSTAAHRQAYAAEVMTNSGRYWALVGMADLVRSAAKARIQAATTEEQFTKAGIDNRAQKDAAIAEAMRQMKGVTP